MQGKIVYTQHMAATALYHATDLSIRQLGRHRFILHNARVTVHPVVVYRSLAHAKKVITLIFLTTAAWTDSSHESRRSLRELVINIIKNTQE